MTEPPSGGYMLCASPRSGSTLLCDMLSRSGAAGAPASYLRPASVAAFATDWGVENRHGGWGAGYLKAIRQHSAGASGCPALRIMWSDMPVVVDRLRTIAPLHTLDKDRLRHLLGIDHFIHLRRDDMVAQAVSLVLASQTGVWHKNADGTVRQAAGTARPPAYDEQQIAAELHMLEAEADGWETWFTSQSISPIRLVYEDLAADPANGLKDVLQAIDRPVYLPLPEPATARLATHVNEEWARRFRRGH